MDKKSGSLAVSEHAVHSGGQDVAGTNGSPTIMAVKDDGPAGRNKDAVSFGPKSGAAAAANNRRFSASSTASGNVLQSERMRALVAGLHNLPELTLEETTRVRSVFTGQLGERESIANILELRVLLGDLGLYPSEGELQLVLEAYRGRIGLSSLCDYLRFYKHEYLTTDKIEAAKQQRLSAGQSGQQAQQQPRLPWMNSRAGNDPYPPSATRAGADTGYSFGTSGKKTLGDPDTLKAFVALGGNEDGSGEIPTAALSTVVREFGLTVDIDAMIAVVDVHHSGVLDYDDFCAMWALPEEALRRGSIGSFSVLDPTRSPRRDDTTIDARAAQAGGDVSPSTQRARERIIAALARSGRQSITLSQGLPWKAAGAGLSPRGTVTAANAAASPHGQMMMMPVATTTGGGAVAPTQQPRVRPLYSCAASNPVLQGPITSEEHMLLLTIYLFPERYEGVFPRPGEGATARHNNTNRHASIGGVMNGTGNRRSMQASRKATSRSAGGAKPSATSADDDDVLGSKGSGYRPPSPMILSMRTSAAYQERKTAKLREPIRCPYHGSGLAATMGQQGGASGYAATANPNATAAEDGYNSNTDMRNATW